MKKVLYLLFYKIYQFFDSISDDSWAEWKALLVLSVANGFILLSVDIYMEICFNISLIMALPKIFFIIFFSIFCLVHYYCFLHNDKWRFYESEFKEYSKSKSRRAGWITFLFLILVMANLIFAFLMMKKTFSICAP